MNTPASLDNQVLSDVHAGWPNQPSSLGQNLELSESRFVFSLPKSLMLDPQRKAGEVTGKTCTKTKCQDIPSPDNCEEKVTDGTYRYDEDGDLVLNRENGQKQSKECSVVIVHKMATDLNMVGQQVWLGALLLCDFMLHVSPLFHGAVVLDLGAGVGLTSIIAALMAQTVFCTDHGADILKLASVNIERNRHLFPTANLHVREIDWNAELLGTDSSGSSSTADEFKLISGEIETLSSCSIILAAEVVYDLELTDAFFSLIYNLLLKQPAKTVYMTVERRQVFTIADREVVSPAYEQFRENLRDLCSIDEGPVRFVCSQIDTSFPKRFTYQRTKELELWKLEAVFVNG